MIKKYILPPSKTLAERKAAETYVAPPPPSKGKIVGLDCHPDSFTAAVFVWQTPHNARKIGTQHTLSLEALLKWAAAELTPKDIILLEAGSNSFEICKRLEKIGLRACVLESCHVGRHAKTYADNDKMAAARIALVYLAGNAPCVWVPDEQSRQRRELLHAYRKAVADHTAATNALKSYLNCLGICLGKRNLEHKATACWLHQQLQGSALQTHLLNEHLSNIAESKERRQRLYRLIGLEMVGDSTMMRCMKLLGVGIVSAFALLAVIGDIRRFDSPEKLVAYIGLNPGQRQSGKGKDIRLGVGRRGRGDLRTLLIQGAHAVLRSGRNTVLGRWGWKLFARKGNRNVAVTAVARKLVVQVWHLLKGHPPLVLEAEKSFRLKLHKLAVVLGSALRREIGLAESLADSLEGLLQRCCTCSG
jgi:transposase